jgi:hypothetical protein
MKRKARERARRGAAQNFANQLSQMAVGVEAMFLGAVLKDEPETGVVELDARSSSATVNGRPRDLALARYVHNWVVAELERTRLDSGWLKSATTRIEYSQNFRDSKRGDSVKLVATSRVQSEVGETTAVFSNNQHLVRTTAIGHVSRTSVVHRVIPLTVAAAAASVAFVVTMIWALSGYLAALPFAVFFGLGAAFALFGIRKAGNVLLMSSLTVVLLGELEPLGGLVASAVAGEPPGLAVIAPLAAGAIAVMALLYAIRVPRATSD